MNYKQTAEAYVRSQLPELMELSFGCELIVSDGSKVFVSTGAYKDSDSDTYRYVSWGAVTKKLYDKPRDTELKVKEIIGHPIELNHWLRVLPDGLYVVDTNGKVWGRYKGYFFQFDMTTGQPKEEEDYQAICKLLNL